MTTKPPPKVRSPEITLYDDDGVFYPETDGMPLPDGFEQEPLFAQVVPVLRAYLKQRYSVIVSGDTFLYYEQGNPAAVVAPDCYVSFGVTDDLIPPLNSYLTWRVGKVPDFVLEIASRSTARRDNVAKRELYARLGVGEYWRYDWTPDSRYCGEPLIGERLVDGEYERFSNAQEPDGLVWAHSPTLGLDLCWDVGRLRYRIPETGEYLRDLQESETALQESEAALQQAEAARIVAEAEAAELREQLRRLQSEQGG